jgi:glutathione synthase/RimK-type ligase-like ATP-grasp enzyme
LATACAIEAMPRDPEEPLRRMLGRGEDGRRVALSDVPATGVRIMLDGPANRAAGGGASAPQDGAPARLAELALAAADALDLPLAAVDMFDGESGPQVIEVNSNPMIATLEDHGRWDLITTIWRANFAAALK